MPGLSRAAYNAAVHDLRRSEYPMLQDEIYLDHAGSTPCPKSLMDAFAADMTSHLYGNPHSASSSSQLAANRIDDVRLRLLGFFKADARDFHLVFVANATAGVKLVVEAMRSLPSGYAYAYHQACHTSLVGAREDAVSSTCLDDDRVSSWLQGQDPFPCQSPAPSARLFSFTAQSHMDGQRFPLCWPKQLQAKATRDSPRLYTLVDAASLSATSQLDLGSPEFAADFVVLSLYKIFGFPDLGALIVRRSAESVFDHRRYFGGGTVDMVVCGEDEWHARKTHGLYERLEDGTLPFHSIIAVDAALQTHQKLFGSMQTVSAHTSYLAQKLRRNLSSIRHENGRPVCVMYPNKTTHESYQLQQGPIVSFNLVDSLGSWVSLTEFEKLAILHKIHIRTGGLCCPGGISAALGLEPWELRRNLSAGFRCGADNDLIPGKPSGVIRASLGAMSTNSDVEKFVDFVKEFFVESIKQHEQQHEPVEARSSVLSHLRVKSLTIYPIKSCRGFAIPLNCPWAVRAEGLVWDREWCLVHRGSGQALSQKRYPSMALLQPTLDLKLGILHVQYSKPGTMASTADHVDIPLSVDPSLFSGTYQQTWSRVCGEDVSAQAYKSDKINDFFSNALGVPCVLARFPPGGRGSGSRSSKARIQRHQQPSQPCRVPGSFPQIPSPPDSDSEQKHHGKILLSNESPILLIYSSSVDALNEEIEARGGKRVSDAVFRANIVVESTSQGHSQPAYSEDGWSHLRIGDQDFRMLGACRRCQMVCVNQTTAERKQEPFATLAKTRRFDGKVYFGAHMCQDGADCSEDKYLSGAGTIHAGQSVTVYR
ncbi:hypothetical protein CDD82_5542 [Ophiocordyceps australis]|uniref:Molybdenum cofactor sulfurase n=1 Tax=Ophiocordyceps australis TaxID=1399860 RepID=A0A2C5Z101_9HYPO|nr:hypothetical protein CDD82_5542 [Ophiocordyceps australis]